MNHFQILKQTQGGLVWLPSLMGTRQPSRPVYDPNRHKHTYAGRLYRTAIYSYAPRSYRTHTLGYYTGVSCDGWLHMQFYDLGGQSIPNIHVR